MSEVTCQAPRGALPSPAVTSPNALQAFSEIPLAAASRASPNLLGSAAGRGGRGPGAKPGRLDKSGVCASPYGPPGHDTNTVAPRRVARRGERARERERREREREREKEQEEEKYAGTREQRQRTSREDKNSPEDVVDNSLAHALQKKHRRDGESAWQNGSRAIGSNVHDSRPCCQATLYYRSRLTNHERPI